MNLTEKQIKDLLNHCKLTLEGAYTRHLTDEYFRKGFLLASTELTKLFVETLKRYEITLK